MKKIWILIIIYIASGAILASPTLQTKEHKTHTLKSSHLKKHGCAKNRESCQHNKDCCHGRCAPAHRCY